MVDSRSIRVVRDKCIACAACPSVCHALALRMRALELVLIEDLCDNCLKCIPTCPTGAIERILKS